MTEINIFADRLIRRLEDVGSRYTRAFGPEDNSARVLDLTVGDVYSIAGRLRAVLSGEEDPGDSRYICGYLGCLRNREHLGAHQTTLTTAGKGR